MKRARLVLAVLLASAAVGGSASAQTTSDPVSPQAIAIPKGEGTIEGLGESFSAQPSTGIATYHVPIALPKPRGNVGNALSLDYSSSNGNGIAGIGWTIGAPFIERQISHGVPKYNDPAAKAFAANQDRFVFGGAELVPLGIVTGGACAAAPGESMPAWAEGWQYFRSRVEGSFTRFYWSPDHRTWRAYDKSGVSMELGVPLDGSGSTNAIEASPLTPTSIFRWNIARAYDDEGITAPLAQPNPAPANVVIYNYSQVGGLSYLSDVYDTPPAGGGNSVATFAHHVHLSYAARTDPTTSLVRGWPVQTTQRLARIDVASKNLAGTGPRELLRRYDLAYFAGLRASQLASVVREGRCASVVQEDANGLLPYAGACAPMPPIRFTYSQGGRVGTTPTTFLDLGTFDTTIVSLGNPPPTTLSDADTDFFDVNADGLPDILHTAPSSGAPQHSIFFNGAGGTPSALGAMTPMSMPAGSTLAASSLAFHQPDVLSLDTDGDALVDLVFLPNAPSGQAGRSSQGSGGWQWSLRAMTTPADSSGSLNVAANRANVRVMDVNGDGLIDIVQSTTVMRTFFNLGRYPGGDGHFGTASWTSGTTATLSPTPAQSCLPGDDLTVQLGQAETRTADMNGDNLVDLVRVKSGRVQYWPGRGDGSWGIVPPVGCPNTTRPAGAVSQIDMSGSPIFLESGGNQQRLVDVNGDGLDDLIDIQAQNVNVYFNLGGAGFSSALHLANTPNATRPVVRLIDVNGSGTRDIVWGNQNDYRYVDLLGEGRPGLLTHVDNGLGRTTDITYQASTSLMLAATKAGQPWGATMPLTVHAVTRTVQSDNLSVAGRPADTVETDFTYRDPVWDGQQREFRGFRQVLSRIVGDSNTPSSTTATTYLTGDCTDETNDGIDDCGPSGRWRANSRDGLRGLAALTETYDDSGVYLSTTHSTYTLRNLYVGVDGRPIRMAFQSASDTWAYDTYAFVGSASALPMADVVLDGATGTVPSSAITLRSTTGRSHVSSSRTVDSFGNTTISTHLGCVDGCPQVDETISTKADYAIVAGDTSAWLYRPIHSWIEGSKTPRRKETTFEYDDRGRLRVTRATLSGTLALDRFSQGSSSATGDAGAAAFALAPTPPTASKDGTLVVSAQDFDAFGNVSFARAPDNRCRTVSYDAAFAEFAVTESNFVGTVGADRGPSGSRASAAFAPTASGSGCGATALNSIAAYDRGLEKATLVTDVHGETTTIAYDALGRLSSLYRPDPLLIGVSEATPSLLVTYDIDQTGARAFGIVHSTSHSGASIAGSTAVGTREAWSYLDGLGRTIVTIEQADTAAGDGAPWVVRGLTKHDARGNPQNVYLPWFSSATPSSFPLATAPTTPSTAHQYDAFGREFRTTDTGGDVSLERHYHALSVDTWDGGDLRSTTHKGTFATSRSDGHGRTVSNIEQGKIGGTLVASETRTDYLATGEAVRITRTAGSTSVVRWMTYDSLGRLVENVDPHTSKNFAATQTATLKAIRYAYDDASELVGTSDARGCGINFFYDAGGREVAQDFSPCEASQPPYTAPSLTTGDGTEEFVRWDVPESDTSSACPQSPLLLLGRKSSISDRGARVVIAYDARGRATCSSKKIAVPGQPTAALASRYAAQWFTQTASFDEADRETKQSTGASAAELLASDGTSAVTTTYTARGLVAVASSSYGPLVNGVVHDAAGNISSIRYGDLASTTTSFTYDSKIRVATVQTTRGAPAQWTHASPGYTPAPASPPSTLETIIENVAFGYDEVGNATSIHDLRDPTAWPAGAKPVSLAMQYDDFYRVSDVAYQYSGSVDTWTSPFDAEDRGIHADTRRGSPAPQASFPQRVAHQSFAYDAFGNSTDVEDDERGFFDRSLGTITNANAAGKPYQLVAASNQIGQSTREGHLSAAYDDAGYMVSLAVSRGGTCLPAGDSCSQRFVYEWDEAGNLSRARRWDVAGDPGPASAVPPTTAASAELQFAYDSNNARTRKTALDTAGSQRHALYPFTSLEVRGAHFDGEAYERTAATEVPYLFAHGSRLARVEYAVESVPSLASGSRHVYMELPDFVGSTAIVVDHDTSELVERTTYTAYGGVDSDYRPERWAAFREDHEFTGKESDVELGLLYFGARYYSPQLGRWLSADPLALHAPSRGDLNLYAYVHGRVFQATDPTGLDADCMCSDPSDMSSKSIKIPQQNQTPASGVIDLDPEGTKISEEFERDADRRGRQRDMFDFMGDVSDAVDVTIDEAAKGKTTGDKLIGYGLVPVVAAMYGVAAPLQPLHAIDNIRHASDHAMQGQTGAAMAAVGWALLDVGTSEFKEFYAPLKLGQFGSEGRIVYGALDHLERPTGVMAKIEEDMIMTGTKANDAISPPGWHDDGTAFNEARGHLLARQLGGSGDTPLNLVTIEQNKANLFMAKYEKQVRMAVEGGETVMYSAIPVYKGDTLVPRGITIQATGSSGFSLSLTILNPPGR